MNAPDFPPMKGQPGLSIMQRSWAATPLPFPLNLLPVFLRRHYPGAVGSAAPGRADGLHVPLGWHPCVFGESVQPAQWAELGQALEPVTESTQCTAWLVGYFVLHPTWGQDGLLKTNQTLHRVILLFLVGFFTLDGISGTLNNAGSLEYHPLKQVVFLGH